MLLKSNDDIPTRSDAFDKVLEEHEKEKNNDRRIVLSKTWSVDWENNCVTNFFKKLFGG